MENPPFHGCSDCTARTACEVGLAAVELRCGCRQRVDGGPSRIEGRGTRRRHRTTRGALRGSRPPIRLPSLGDTRGGLPPFYMHSAREIRTIAERPPDAPALLLGKMRDLPDFAAIRCNRGWGENAKIHDEHLGATEAYVDWLVQAFEAVVRTIRF
jgi:hypothetical protein